MTALQNAEVANGWLPPTTATRPDGFECFIWHSGMWRHVKWQADLDCWMFGYGSALASDHSSRLYAPLPTNTPEHDFWEAETK